MFRISAEETEAINQSQTVTGSQKHRDPRYPPRVFTQEGVSMLSSVLRSQRAVQINIAIMRTFVRLREMLATHKDLARKIEEHDQHITNLYAHVERILTTPAEKKKPIGYIWPKDEEWENQPGSYFLWPVFHNKSQISHWKDSMDAVRLIQGRKRISRRYNARLQEKAR